ncbi:hypothetical protein SRS16CHR_04305 [Variovorax sp. SRS16]|uniref:hypothetical protein n=1 Tax=Variovorax sp. SRS16 TaxID=282217 RepID=UPI0013187979|nr:hypothetical protein [Variovorax sp. SRS16]VTU28633.1 hypothetical protein SRS16CHR_04305 [Variovorax sp. SRS16]
MKKAIVSALAALCLVSAQAQDFHNWTFHEGEVYGYTVPASKLQEMAGRKQTGVIWILPLAHTKAALNASPQTPYVDEVWIAYMRDQHALLTGTKFLLCQEMFSLKKRGCAEINALPMPGTSMMSPPQTLPLVQGTVAYLIAQDVAKGQLKTVDTHRTDAYAAEQMRTEMSLVR